MAKKTITSLVDDLDGSDAAGTVTFGLDGRMYEIDLSSSNIKLLNDALAPFITHADPVRTASDRRRGGTRDYSSAARRRSADIREFAKVHELPVSDHGRIPDAVVRQFDQGYPDPQVPKPEDLDTSTAAAVSAAVEVKAQKPERARKAPVPAVFSGAQ